MRIYHEAWFFWKQNNIWQGLIVEDYIWNILQGLIVEEYLWNIWQGLIVQDYIWNIWQGLLVTCCEAWFAILIS